MGRHMGRYIGRHKVNKGRYKVNDKLVNPRNLNYDTIVYIQRLKEKFWDSYWATLLEVTDESDNVLYIYDEKDSRIRPPEEPIFIEFLDKFCIKEMDKFFTKEMDEFCTKKIATNTFKVFDYYWKTEFGFLMEAYQWFKEYWFKENSNEFEKAVKKAKNKEEFKLLLGVR